MIAIRFVTAALGFLLGIEAQAGECPEDRYSGDIHEIVELEIQSFDMPAERKNEYAIDVQISVLPKRSVRGLTFYGGGIQHGVPIQLHSVLEYRTDDEKRVAWFLTQAKDFGNVRLLLWYHGPGCHMTAAFRLSEHRRAKAWRER